MAAMRAGAKSPKFFVQNQTKFCLLVKPGSRRIKLRASVDEEIVLKRNKAKTVATAAKISQFFTISFLFFDTISSAGK